MKNPLLRAVAFFVRRLLGSIASVPVIITLLFWVFHVGPGGAMWVYQLLPAEVQRRIIQEYGLDQPIWTQYFNFMGRILTGNYGTSFASSGAAVGDVVGARMSNTLQLWGLTMLFVVLLALLILGLGLAVLWLRGRAPLLGNGLRRLGQCIASLKFLTPALVVGVVLYVILAVKLRVFPVGGMYDLRTGPGDPGDFLKHAFLPALSLALLPAYLVARSVAGEFAHYADRRNVGKGLLIGHVAARFVADGLIQGIGLLGGALVIETLFSWPGLGYLLARSVTNRDYPVIVGGVMTLLWLTLVLRLLSDLFRAVSLGLSARLDKGAEERKPRPARPLDRVLGIAWVVFVVLLVLVPLVVGLGGAFIAPYDPIKQSPSAVRLPPSAAHLLGTDSLGRDVLSRLLYAMRLDLGLALVVTLVAFVPAMLGGLLAGLLARCRALWADLLDGLVMFPVEILAALPGVVLLVVVLSSMVVMNVKKTPVETFSLAVVFYTLFYTMPRLMRLVREGTATVSSRGGVGWAILRLLGVVIAAGLVGPALTLFALFAMSFLGLGEATPTAQLGSMVRDGLVYARTVDVPVGVLAPALAIVFLTGGWFLLAETVLSKVGVHKRESWLDVNR